MDNKDYDISFVKDYFIRINNKNAFLEGDIPSLHPDSNQYAVYWKDKVIKCIDGLWAQDTKNPEQGGMWRWMPPTLYFYVNFGTILHNDPNAPKTAPKKKMRPYLRDVEWEFSYNWAEARGFSGFKGDPNFSCHRVLADDELLSDKDKIIKIYCTNPENGEIIENAYNNIFKENGDYKTYISAREYLRQLHDFDLGTAYWQNEALNLFMLGARGFGKSYLVGISVVLHELLFDGCKEYSIENLKNPNTVEVFVGAAHSSKSSDIIKKTKMALANLPGEWKQPGYYRAAPLYKKFEGSTSPNNTKNPWRHEYSQKIEGEWVDGLGSGSNLKHGIYTIDNPEAAAGTRPGVMVIEEVGLLPNLLNVHGSNTACQMEGAFKFGSSVYLGTGGNMDKIRESEEIFRNPSAYNFLEFDDRWENSGNIGWFVPAYYGLNQYKDENGNTDLQGAYNELMRERERIKTESNSFTALALEMMNRPIVPSEMFLTKQGNIFPVAELSNRLRELKKNNYWKSMGTPISLYFDSKKPEGVGYTVDTEGKLDPLDTFPMNSEQKKNPEGCPLIYEFPTKIDGKVPDDMYLFSLDPYVSDEQDAGGSLGAFYVFKNSKYALEGFGYNQIVAEYVAKPYGGRIVFNQNVEKLIMMYGSPKRSFYFENNRGNTVEYFTKRNKLHLLSRKPRKVLTKTHSKSSNTRIEYGYSVPTRGAKIELMEMLRDFSLEERTSFEGQKVLNLDLFPKSLCEEMIQFDYDNGNFDRIMGVAGSILGLRETENELIDEQERANQVDVYKFFKERSIGKNNPLFGANKMRI